MIRLWMMLLLVALLSFKAYAADENPNAIMFEGVQEHCVQLGEIKFGPGAHWNSCHITRARWVSTINLIDMYQTQYCLGKDEQSCEQRAWVLFANRAYTKEAKALVVRMDPSTTVYKDPLVIVTGDNYLMSMPSYNADGVESINYFMWHMGDWVPVESQAWVHNLTAKLPKGTSIRQVVWPDLESMSAEVNLFKSSDSDCCPTGGKAKVDLGFEGENFSVKKVNVSSATQ
jgi:hypothetical protein